MIPNIDPRTSYFAGVNQIRTHMGENFTLDTNEFGQNANTPTNISFKRVSQIFLANGAFFAVNACKTALAIIATPFALFGTKNFSNTTTELAMACSPILSMPFLMTLKCIRPNSPIIPIDSAHEAPPITRIALTPLLNKLDELKDSNHWFKKHICTRVLFATAGVVGLISHIADLAIGICAAVFALITLGKFQALNSYAFRSLCGTDAIGALSVCIRGAFRPGLVE